MSSLETRASPATDPAPPRLSGDAFEQGGRSVLRVVDGAATTGDATQRTDVWRVGVAFGADGGKVVAEWTW